MVLAFANFASAGLTQEEAAKLDGPVLTIIGAEKAGSKDGIIPPYTGGITKGADGWYYEGKLKVPSSKYDPKSGLRPDPFADDKILYTITSQNMAQYADKLTDGLKALLTRYPDVKLNVYPTRRSMSYSPYMQEMQKKYATTANLKKDGKWVADVRSAFPFPIPKNGLEAAWNHIVRWSGSVEQISPATWLVNANGQKINVSQSESDFFEFPYWDPKSNRFDMIYVVFDNVVGPANRVGEGLIGMAPTDKTWGGGQPVWQYLPGQRRVKLAPEVSFDGPCTTYAGAGVYDECYMYTGSPEKYDWKILGKRELVIPYNTYKAFYWTKSTDLLGQHFFNAEYLRNEVHRCWVIEGKLKPGLRHIYHRRILYLDEDSWVCHMADQFDAKDRMWRIKYLIGPFNYDIQAPATFCDTGIDLISGIYYLAAHVAEHGGVKYVPSRPEKQWAPAALMGRGIR